MFLWRAPGGFWTTAELADRVNDQGDRPPWYYKTQTVRGLVRRGLAELNKEAAYVRITDLGERYLSNDLSNQRFAKGRH